MDTYGESIKTRYIYITYADKVFTFKLSKISMTLNVWAF